MNKTEDIADDATVSFVLKKSEYHLDNWEIDLAASMLDEAVVIFSMY